MTKATDTHPNWRDKWLFSRINTIAEINVIRLALRYQQAEKRNREYENLLQEKHGIKAHAQIAHLFFANTQSNVEKTKELFLAIAP